MMQDYMEDQSGFTCAHEDYERADAVIVGIPYDGTASHYPGARFGPTAIRQSSWMVETYSPELKSDLLQKNFCDLQDISIYGTQQELFANICTVAHDIAADGKKFIGLGGEHSITFPVIKGIHEAIGELIIISFDAHLDLRDEYLGNPLSHASVMRRCREITPHLYHFGVRSGAAEEWKIADQCNISRKLPTSADIKSIIDSELPLYITIDIDVLDPAYAPGTGSPEPGGVSASELLRSIYKLNYAAEYLVGFDVVEICPPCETGSTTAVLGAKIVRDMLLMTLK